MSPSDEMNAMAFGEQSSLATDYFAERASSFLQTLPQAANTFMVNACQDVIYQATDAARELTRSLLGHATAMYHGDIIRPLTTVTEIQTAQPMMQRWIMAQPDIRRAYHDKELNGYSNEYIDMSPGQVGMNHRDYRIITNGMHMTDDDGCDYYAEHVEYMDEEDGEIASLTHGEKHDVVKITWEHAKAIVRENKYDPVNPWGGKR